MAGSGALATACGGAASGADATCPAGAAPGAVAAAVCAAERIGEGVAAHVEPAHVG